MADITTRAGKGSPLTNNEVDANFTNLNTDKAENGDNTDITSLSGVTGGISEADYLDLDLTASSSRQEGRIRWNNADKTAEIDLHGSSVTLQVGQENVLYVYNNESSEAISNGDVVYIYSAAGNQVSVRKYISDGTVQHGLVLGVATEDIAYDSFGYITIFGMIRGLDTSDFSVEDVLYASADTAGHLTNVKPESPNKVVEIGVVVKSNALDGLVFVSPFEIHEAEEIYYNNTDSGLTASNVKAAIDELEVKKADVSLLQANINFYATTASSPVTGYNKLVTSVDDADFDTTAVDVSTGTVTSAETLIASLASDTNVIDGSVSGITITTLGEIRRTSGNGMGRFWFEVYKRDSGGTETLLATSPKTEYIQEETYTQLFDAVFVSSGTVAATDRVVLKFYGQTDNQDAVFDFRFGGNNPIRSLFPVAVSVIPQVTTAGSITSDTSAFGGILSGSDTTVQAALDTIDDHGHGIADISLLQSELDAKALKTTAVAAGSGLTGGGDLSANRTISHADTSSVVDLTATARTYVDSLDFDEFGHVVGYSTSTETVVDTDTVTRVGVDGASYTSGDINFVGTNSATVSKLGNTVTVDVSVTDSNNYANSLGFTGGTLTIGREGLSSLSTSLDGRYLQSESDPVFTASPAGGISTLQISSWNTAYSWGDHASAGYLPSSSYTASDVLTKIKTVDGSGSGLDADTLDGLQPSVSASNNTIVQRHASGYIFANYFNTTPNDVSSGVTKVCVETGNDGYIRHGTAAAIHAFLGADRRIAAGNNVLYGTSTSYCNYQSSSGTKYARWYLEGDEDMRLTEGGSLICNGNVTAYSTTIASDARLKKDVETIDNALDLTCSLRGVSFTWNEKSNREGVNDYGLIAQEVQEHLPELVVEADTLGSEDETHLTVDYPKLVGVLIEAIKELKAEIDALKEAN